MSTSTSTRKALINFRSKTFWIVSLFLLYSLFGWVLVPMILDAQLKQILKSSANWETSIDQIVFNPYALSLELSGANIDEENQDPVLDFERFYVNFSLLSSLGGTVSFDEIALEKPQIYLDLDASGTTNFQRAFASDTEETQETSQDEASGEPLALFFKLIAISEGQLYFTDNAKEQAFQLTLAPLSLSLEDFSTQHNEGGDYALSIALGNDQSLNWRGQIGIAPLQSTGHLQLSQIDSATFWHYAKDASPYWLNQAKVSLSGDYRFANQTDGLLLVIDKAELRLDEVVLSEHQAGEQWLAFKQLSVAPIAFDLQALSLDLGHIILDAPKLSLSRAEDASLNILRPLAAQTGPEAEIETESSTQAQTSSSENASPFKWQLADFHLNKGSIHWTDQALSTPAELNIEQFALQTGAISHDLSQAFPFEVNFTIADEGSTQAEANAPSKLNRIKGSLSPAPFQLQGDADIHDIDLTLLQNYLADLANITIKQGRFNLNANYALALNEHLSGSLTSSLQIDELSLSDANQNKPFSGFKQLAIGPVDITLPVDKREPPSISIEQISLDQVYADIFIAKDGQMNLSQLAKAPPSSAEQTNNTGNTDAAEPEAEESAAPDIELLLNTFKLTDAKLSYTDASLKPAFSTTISELSGTIEGISSAPDAKSKVALSGKLDELGSVAINGTLNPLGASPNSHILLQVNNIDLTAASPYSAKYAGYLIDKGKLDLDLNYLIEGSKLKAGNQISLNQLEFGKSVKSPDATSLPLPLAIGILKDRKGSIDIDLPIAGNLDDPSFKITSVLLNTFVNLITKVVTSPFSILGGLIEGGDTLSEVSFNANSSELEADQMQGVLSLAKALKERPKLTLEIRGIADANIDRLENAIRSDAELLQLAKLRAQKLSQFVIEQGGIDSARVFVLEPSVVPATEAKTQKAASTPSESANTEQATVSAKFTLGVR